MLISAYSAMIFSPTILTVLPEGGDSRKQMIAIFVLALFGCTVFTVYAASLFFRKEVPSDRNADGARRIPPQAGSWVVP